MRSVWPSNKGWWKKEKEKGPSSKTAALYILSWKSPSKPLHCCLLTNFGGGQKNGVHIQAFSKCSFGNVDKCHGTSRIFTTFHKLKQSWYHFFQMICLGGKKVFRTAAHMIKWYQNFKLTKSVKKGWTFVWSPQTFVEAYNGSLQPTQKVLENKAW